MKPLLMIIIMLAADPILAAESATKFIPVTTVNTGQVYWLGHEQSPPFRFSLGFTVQNHDTTGWGTYINDLPLVLPLTAEGSKIVALQADASARPNPHGEIFNRAQLIVRQQLKPTNDPKKFGEAMVKELAKDSRVRSAEYLGSWTLKIIWADTGRLAYETFSRDGPPPDPRSNLLDQIRSIKEGLRAGNMILIGAGGMISQIPRDDIPAVMAEMDSLRSLQAVTFAHLSPFQSVFFTRTIPVERLLKGDVEGN